MTMAGSADAGGSMRLEPPPERAVRKDENSGFCAAVGYRITCLSSKFFNLRFSKDRNENCCMPAPPVTI
jgi:hypothetical protein